MFYNKVEPVLTLTKDDFVPMYFTDDDGNQTDEVDFFYYKGTPQLDWFTSPDKIGFVVQFTVGEEQITINHHLPGVTTEVNDGEWTESGYMDEENRLYPWFYCDDCGIAIQNGMSISSGKLEPEDCFFIQTDWHDGESVGFDSITIYRMTHKSIPHNVIPQPDWNQNDPNGEGYIKNRPFYKSIGDETLFDGYVTLDHAFDPTLNITDGYDYIIIVNGVEYTPARIYFDDTDTAWCINVRDDNLGASFWISARYASWYYDSGEHPEGLRLTVIKKDVETVRSIPSEFLPDAVMRSDIAQNLTDEEKETVRNNIGALPINTHGRIIYATSVKANNLSASPAYNVTLAPSDRAFLNQQKIIDNSGESVVGTILCIPRIPAFNGAVSVSTSNIGLSINNVSGMSGDIHDIALVAIKCNERQWEISDTVFFMYAGNCKWVHLPITRVTPSIDITAQRQHRYGWVQLEDSVSSTKVAGYAATPNSVKTAYDKAVEGINAANAIADGTTPILIPSSTEGSTKKFKITVDDSGTITATEVT